MAGSPPPLDSQTLADYMAATCWQLHASMESIDGRRILLQLPDSPNIDQMSITQAGVVRSLSRERESAINCLRRNMIAWGSQLGIRAMQEQNRDSANLLDLHSLLAPKLNPDISNFLSETVQRCETLGRKMAGSVRSAEAKLSSPRQSTLGAQRPRGGNHI